MYVCVCEYICVCVYVCVCLYCILYYITLYYITLYYIILYYIYTHITTIIIITTTTGGGETNLKERIRVEAAGGKVINSRVNGVLAISRAFGDIQMKYFGSGGNTGKV